MIILKLLMLLFLPFFLMFGQNTDSINNLSENTSIVGEAVQGGQ